MSDPWPCERCAAQHQLSGASGATASQGNMPARAGLSAIWLRKSWDSSTTLEEAGIDSARE